MRAALESWGGLAGWRPWVDVLAMVVVALSTVVVVSILKTVRARARWEREARQAARERAWRLRDQSGAAAVEAALVLPILLLVALGGLDLGLLVVDHGLAASTASEVCRAVAAEEPHEPAVLSPVSGGAFAVSIVLVDGWADVEVSHSRPPFAPMLPGDRTVLRTASCVVGEVTR